MSLVISVYDLNLNYIRCTVLYSITTSLKFLVLLLFYYGLLLVIECIMHDCVPKNIGTM